VRLILFGRWLGRQLCRIRLHKWEKVNTITGLKLRAIRPGPDGGGEAQFWATGTRLASICARCDVERDA
jgi:hypothetical protein